MLMMRDLATRRSPSVICACIFQGFFPTAMSAVLISLFVFWFRSVAPTSTSLQPDLIGLTGEAIAAGKLHNIAQAGADPGHGGKIVLVHGFGPR